MKANEDLQFLADLMMLPQHLHLRLIGMR